MKAIFRAFISSYQGLPKQVWLLSAVMLINRAGGMVLPFLALYFTQSRGISLEKAGLIVGIYGFGSALGSLAGGWISDHLNPFKLQFYSLGLASIVLWWMPYVTSVWGLALTTFLVSFFVESFRPSNSTAMILICPPPLRRRAFALNRLAINLGSAVGPSIGGILAGINYVWLFRIDSVTCLLAGIFVLSMNWRPCTAPATGITTPVQELLPAPDLHPFQDRLFLTFFLLFLIVLACIFQIFTTIPIYFKAELGIAESGYGLLMGLNGLLIILFEMAITKKVENTSVFPILVWAHGFYALCFLCAIIFHGYAAGLVIIITFTIGEMLHIPNGHAWAANRAGKTHIGKYMGFMSMAGGLAWMIGPSTGAWVYAKFGPNPLWIACCLVTTGCGLFFLWLSHQNQDVPSQQAPVARHDADSKPRTKAALD